MPQYVQDIEDARGDIVERRFYCRHCAPADLLPWPGYEAIDYPEYCEECAEPVGNPLTDDGMRYLHNLLVDFDEFTEHGHFTNEQEKAAKRIQQHTDAYGDDARFPHRYTLTIGMPGYMPNHAEHYRGSRNAAEAAHDEIERDADMREDASAEVPTVEAIHAELEADGEYRFEFPDSPEVLTLERII